MTSLASRAIAWRNDRRWIFSSVVRLLAAGGFRRDRGSF
jgi:hypothetical protein